ELNLSFSNFHYQVQAELIAALGANKTIRHLFLDAVLNTADIEDRVETSTEVSESLGVLVAEMLANNFTLETFSLNKTEFTVDTELLIFRSLQLSHTISDLRLAEFGDGHHSFVDVPFNPTIKRLDLSNNEWIRGEDAKKIALALGENKSIQEINLTGSF